MLFSRNLGQDINYEKGTSMQISEWTDGGSPTEQHQILRFDLSALPDNAIIESAKLSLFFNPDNLDGRGYGHYGDVATNFSISRITENWDEKTVTWNTRPAEDPATRISLSGHTLIDQNYPDIDVTELIRQMFTGENNGFYMQMDANQRYQMLKFCTSDHPDPELHPRLVITYSSVSCGTFRIDETSGQDAFALRSSPALNYGTEDEISVAFKSLQDGTTEQKRAFLAFDLSEIPTQDSITDARLFLYFPNGTTTDGGLHVGDNSIEVSPITKPWNQATLTWNNQPSVSTEQQMVLPASTDDKSDYLGADITELIRTIHASTSYYGFSLGMEERTAESVNLIASGDHPIVDYHPMLKVCWEKTTSTNSRQATSEHQLDLFPNPSNGRFTLDLRNVPAGQVSYQIADPAGRIMFPSTKLNGRNLTQLDLNALPKGMYFLLTFLDGRPLSTNKLMVLQNYIRP